MRGSVSPDLALGVYLAVSVCSGLGTVLHGLRNITGQVDGNELQVNSYHHQGVATLGRNLKPMAYAPDGVLEGFYDCRYSPQEGRFTVGLQFHPERMLGDYPGCKAVYDDFMMACKSFKARQHFTC